MKKIKNIIIPLILLPLIFSACKDDPVTPRPDNSFDSARFEWDIDTLHNVIKGIWAEDTLNIFILVGDGFLDYDGENYPSGLYFYVLESGDYVSTKKMVLIK